MSFKLQTVLQTPTKNYPYKLARLANDHIVYYAYDPKLKKLRRLRDYIPKKLKTDKEKASWVRERIETINSLLRQGYIYKHKKASLIEAVNANIELRRKTTRQRSYEGYKSITDVFHRWLVREKLHTLLPEQLSKDHIKSFLLYILQEREVGNRTYNNYLKTLNTIFNDFVREGILQANPSKGLKKLRVDKGRNLAFSVKEQKLLENWLMKNDYALYTFTRFVYYCFLRPSEILGLQPHHIDLDNGTISIPAKVAKNRRASTIHMPRKLQSIATGWLDALPIGNQDETKEAKKDYCSSFVFGKKLKLSARKEDRKRVSERHRKAIKATGLDKNSALTLYSWKHTGVVRAYKAGVDLKTIQSQCRHSSLDMTDKYLKSLGLNDYQLPDDW